MYLPPHFQQHDPAEIRRFMAENAFATVVTVVDGMPFASHIPLLLEDGEPLRLSGHLAKANPQWQHFADNPRVMVIFQGAHAYVSPTSYETAGVPTWNYTAIHVYGRVSLIHEREALRDLVHHLSSRYEGQGENAWAPSYPDKMLDAIVGFTIDVDEVQAKYKLSQNRSQTDRENVANVLQASPVENDRNVAVLMQRTNKNTSEI